MDVSKRSELDSLKIKLAIMLTLFTIVSMFVVNTPINVRGAGGVFPVGQNVTMGNQSKSIQLTFHNITIDVIELTFTNDPVARPIIDIRGFEPQGSRIAFNQSRDITNGNDQWIVLTQILPTVTGLQTNSYTQANSTLKITATGNETVVLSFPIAGLVGTTLPLLFLLPVLALLPLGKHKIIIVLVSGLAIMVVIASAG